MATTLVEVEQLARELTPADQARLIQFLAPRVAAAVPEASSASSSAAAWQRFRAVGNRLAAGSRPGEGMTQAVSDMRR